MDDVHGPRPRRADPALMRQINAVTTLRTLYRGATMTLTEIVAATGLARRTAEAAVERLIDDGLVAEIPPSPVERSVGRPARAFRFRPDAGYVLSLDIGVHRVGALVADLTGEIRSKFELAVARTAGRAERIRAALAAVEQCRDDAGIDLTDLWATTVGTPGLVEDSRRVTLCHVLPEWSDFSPADELSGVIPGEIRTENDTNLSAVAEHWCGAAADADHLVWVLTGRRVSAAILIDGELYRGADGAAGEVGWSPELGWSTANEQPLSFTGAARTRAGEQAADIVARAVAGEPEARHDIDAFARSLAPGLTALVLALNPRHLVVGGGIATAGETLLNALDGHMRPHCLRMPELRTSTLGTDSVTLGAVRLGLDRVESRLFSLPAPPPAPSVTAPSTGPRGAVAYRR